MSKERRIRWAGRKVRAKRATACADRTWLVPTESSREIALLRVQTAWLDGYDSAMRDARKGMNR